MYSIEVNENFKFEVEEDQLSQFDFLQISDTHYHIIDNEKASYNAAIKAMDAAAKSFTVTINQNDYQVNISDQLDQLVNQLGLSVGKDNAAKEVKAPMPGLVLDILVTEGQEVQQGESLIILEAMKMENVLKAAGDGRVQGINVKQGEAVNKNHILIELA